MDKLPSISGKELCLVLEKDGFRLRIFPINSFLCESIFFVFSGGKKLLIIDTMNMMTERSRNIFIVSYIKNSMASPSREPCSSFIRLYVTYDANSSNIYIYRQIVFKDI